MSTAFDHDQLVNESHSRGEGAPLVPPDKTEQGGGLPPASLCAPATDLTAAAQLMGTHHIRHLPVLDRGRMVGMVSLRDRSVATPPCAKSTKCDVRARRTAPPTPSRPSRAR